MFDDANQTIVRYKFKCCFFPLTPVKCLLCPCAEYAF